MGTNKPPGQKTAMHAKGDPVKHAGKLDAETKAQIGQKLRRLYSGIVSQGCPDRFTDVLKRLDDTEEGGTNG
jgi:Anti-sigma factor NepR